MEKSEDEPYHTTIEVVNKQCKGLKMLKELGIQQCTLVDVRSIPKGLTRHLVRIPSKQIKKVSSSKRIKIVKSDKPKGETSAWFDVDATIVSPK